MSGRDSVMAFAHADVLDSDGPKRRGRTVSIGSHDLDAEFLMCARDNDIAGMRSLLRKGASIGHRDALGQTALHIAAYNGNTEMVEFLVLHGIDPDVEANDGLTAYQLALAEDEKEAARLIRVRSRDIQQIERQHSRNISRQAAIRVLRDTAENKRKKREEIKKGAEEIAKMGKMAIMLKRKAADARRNLKAAEKAKEAKRVAEAASGFRAAAESTGLKLGDTTMVWANEAGMSTERVAMSVKLAAKGFEEAGKKERGETKKGKMGRRLMKAAKDMLEKRDSIARAAAATAIDLGEEEKKSGKGAEEDDDDDGGEGVEGALHRARGGRASALDIATLRSEILGPKKAQRKEQQRRQQQEAEQQQRQQDHHHHKRDHHHHHKKDHHHHHKKDHNDDDDDEVASTDSEQMSPDHHKPSTTRARRDRSPPRLEPARIHRSLTENPHSQTSPGSPESLLATNEEGLPSLELDEDDEEGGGGSAGKAAPPRAAPRTRMRSMSDAGALRSRVTVPKHPNGETGPITPRSSKIAHEDVGSAASSSRRTTFSDLRDEDDDNNNDDDEEDNNHHHHKKPISSSSPQKQHHEPSSASKRSTPRGGPASIQSAPPATHEQSTTPTSQRTPDQLVRRMNSTGSVNMRSPDRSPLPPKRSMPSPLDISPRVARYAGRSKSALSFLASPLQPSITEEPGHDEDKTTSSGSKRSGGRKRGLSGTSSKPAGYDSFKSDTSDDAAKSAARLGRSPRETYDDDDDDEDEEEEEVHNINRSYLEGEYDDDDDDEDGEEGEEGSEGHSGGRSRRSSDGGVAGRVRSNSLASDGGSVRAKLKKANSDGRGKLGRASPFAGRKEPSDADWRAEVDARLALRDKRRTSTEGGRPPSVMSSVTSVTAQEAGNAVGRATPQIGMGDGLWGAGGYAKESIRIAEDKARKEKERKDRMIARAEARRAEREREQQRSRAQANAREKERLPHLEGSTTASRARRAARDHVSTTTTKTTTTKKSSSSSSSSPVPKPPTSTPTTSSSSTTAAKKLSPRSARLRPVENPPSSPHQPTPPVGPKPAASPRARSMRATPSFRARFRRGNPEFDMAMRTIEHGGTVEAQLLGRNVVKQWFGSLSLEKYAEPVIEAGYDSMERIALLEADDLQEVAEIHSEESGKPLRVPPGHRKHLLAAAAELRAVMEAADAKINGVDDIGDHVSVDDE